MFRTTDSGSANVGTHDLNNTLKCNNPDTTVDTCCLANKVDNDICTNMENNGQHSINITKTIGLHKNIGRDLHQVRTPLLTNGNTKLNNCIKLNGNEHESSCGNNVIAYDQTASNNNDWSVVSTVVEQVKSEMIQKHINNNGTLLNGKNGIGLTDKYGEQDPLTGLCSQHHNKLNTDSETDDSDGSSQKYSDCGLFGFQPKWARSLASTNIFMIVFLLAYVLQGMFQTYFVSVITTIEKLFQIKSKTTGILLSAAEMGQICTALLLTYFAGQGHRPRWIAYGMVIWSFAVFTCALPHFLFGKQLLHSTSILALSSSSLPSSQIEVPMFHNNSQHQHLIHSFNANLCIMGDNNNNAINSDCTESLKTEQENHSEITMIVLCILFASIFSSGIGQTAVGTLGIPYIDDNVSSKQTPMYMAITLGVRILGPACGFFVGSFCTRIYVDLTNPGFGATDTRWIGAWWLGPVIIGSIMLLSSIAMFSFPRELRKKSQILNGSNPTIDNKKITIIKCEKKAIESKPKLRDFPKSVRRQLSNDILMFRTASVVFHLLPISGLYIFLPKYLETQFHLTPYNANMFAASCGILVMGVGIVTSGWIMMKLKPSAKAVAAWIAATALMYSIGMIVLMFLGCNMNDFAGYQSANGSRLSMMQPACDAAKDCLCDQNQFAPICGIDGKIYLSSCHAGCEVVNKRQTDNHVTYTKCACIENNGNNLSWYDNTHNMTDINNDILNDISYEAISGLCDSNCQNFIVFIFIFVLCVFMHSTSEVGSTVLMMRCTDPKDKAMAMGVMQSAIGLFGNIPCPIIYGAVVDSACLLWKTVCGQNGACSLYDTNTFRHFYLGITSGIMFLAFIMDIIVWSKADRINITPEEESDTNTTNNMDENKIGIPDTNV